MFGFLGGITGARAERKVQDSIKKQQRENEDWFNRRYNEDSTQRADAQRILTRTEQMLKDNTRRAAATAAVAGGTDESVAQQKAAAANAVADAAAQISASGDARKDAIEANYLNRDAQLNSQMNESTRARMQHIGSAVSGALDSAADMMGMGALDMFKK